MKSETEMGMEMDDWAGDRGVLGGSGGVHGCSGESAFLFSKVLDPEVCIQCNLTSFYRL